MIYSILILVIDYTHLWFHNIWIYIISGICKDISIYSFYFTTLWVIDSWICWRSTSPGPRKEARLRRKEVDCPICVDSYTAGVASGRSTGLSMATGVAPLIAGWFMSWTVPSTHGWLGVALLVGGLVAINLIFPEILGISNHPLIDELIFFRGVFPQPPTSPISGTIYFSWVNDRGQIGAQLSGWWHALFKAMVTPKSTQYIPLSQYCNLAFGLS